MEYQYHLMDQYGWLIQTTTDLLNIKMFAKNLQRQIVIIVWRADCSRMVINVCVKCFIAVY